VPLAGNFMEPSAILLIMLPILFPIAMQLGIDPVHLGIILVVNMGIGLKCLVTSDSAARVCSRACAPRSPGPAAS
jgi:hypothetical protein